MCFRFDRPVPGAGAGYFVFQDDVAEWVFDGESGDSSSEDSDGGNNDRNQEE